MFRISYHIVNHSFLLALIVFISGCAPFKTPVIKDINKFAFKRNQGTNFNFDFGLTLANENPYRLTLVDMDVEVYLNDKKIGTANVPFKQFIRKKSSGDIVFSMDADLQNFLGGAWDMITAALSKDKKSVFKLKGKIKGRVLAVTKTFPFEFGKEFGFAF